MHPLLATKGRITLYLLIWAALGGLLGYLLTITGRLSWLEASILALPLALFYSFVCLAPWYMCRFLPLGPVQLPKLLGNHMAAAVVAALFWIVLAKVLGLGLSRYYPTINERFSPQLPLVFGIGVLLYLLSVALHYVLLPVDGLRARDMCIKLSDFLRNTLSLGERQSISFGDELALAQAYQAVEQVRFGSRLRIELKTDSACDDCTVPPLFLQPLVENAVKHGIAGLVEGGTIRLEAHCEEGWLQVTIQNEFDPEAPAAQRHGLGLQNVRNRLRAVYENQARIDTVVTGNVFVVAVDLPCGPRAFWEGSFNRLDA